MREDVYAVDADELASLVDDLARSHVALADLATDLDGQITDLHSSWSGSAADAHAIAQSTWDDGFAGMGEALTRMRQAADTAHRNYTSAASANLRMWAELG